MSTGVMLAAGQGKRIRPLTNTRPKVMLPLGNKPIIEWNLIKAKNAGIKHFIFIIGYKSEMVRNYFKDGSSWNVEIEYINQGKPQGTGHAIGMIEPFIDADFLVLSGDTIFETQDIKTIINTPHSMGLYTVDDATEYGVVETQDQKVQKIHEKMSQPISNTINAGIYHFPLDIFNIIQKTEMSRRGEYEITDAINTLCITNPLHAIQINQFRDIGYPWDMLEANKDILETISKKYQGTIEKHVTMKGPVILGTDTVVMNGSYIEGPVVIGDNCKIGPNCYIRPYTSIGNHCHVGAASEIKNSIIMDYSNIPHHNYVGDSVIGQGCNLGSGTKIANLRLDKSKITVDHYGKRIQTKRRKLGVIMGDHVQTGINAVINVGSIIGNEVFIGPGTIVQGCIKQKTRLL